MTPEQLDALAEWWRSALDDIRATLLWGGPGWNDVQAKLTIIRAYEESREETSELDGESFLEELATKRRDTLGWVMRTLALPYADRPGWVDSWRPEE